MIPYIIGFLDGCTGSPVSPLKVPASPYQQLTTNSQPSHMVHLDILKKIAAPWGRMGSKQRLLELILDLERETEEPQRI
jgi:hypothetical protein